MRAEPLPALTSLRFFAAASIVYFHMQTFKVLPSVPNPDFALGVSFFFVLSGFILAYNYRDLARGGLGRFYIARFARLFPVHIVTFVFAALFVLPWNLWTFGPSLITVPYNLTLTHAWLPLGGLVFSWNAVSWSISAELFFYLLFPVLIRTRYIGTWCLALLATALTIVAVVHATIGLANQPGVLPLSGMHALLQFPPVRAFEFCVGVAVGRAFAAGRRLPGNASLLEVASLAALAVSLVASHRIGAWFHANGLSSFTIWISQAFCVGAFALVILSVGTGRGLIGKALSHRSLELLGKISFATYMIHHMILNLAVQHEVSALIGWPATIASLIVVIYAGSWLVWRYVEEPARHWIVGRFPARPASLPAGQAEERRPPSPPRDAGPPLPA